MRLLVVEDDRDISRQLVAALTDAGYAADAAFDGEGGAISARPSHTTPLFSIWGCLKSMV